MTIKASYYRPIFIWVFLAILPTTADYLVTNIQSGLTFLCLIMAGLFILAHIFRVKQNIAIKDNQLSFNLDDYTGQIKIDSIISIEFDERHRKLSVEAPTSKFGFKIIGFSRKDLKKLITTITGERGRKGDIL